VNSRKLWKAGWLLVLLVLVGCGGQKKTGKVDVAGAVVNSGAQELPLLVLTLNPLEDSNKHDYPSLLVELDGRFQGKCLPGRYQVMVAPLPCRGKGDHGIDGPLLSPSYLKPFSATAFSPLEISIPPQGKMDIAVTLQWD